MVQKESLVLGRQQRGVGPSGEGRRGGGERGESLAGGVSNHSSAPPPPHALSQGGHEPVHLCISVSVCLCVHVYPCVFMCVRVCNQCICLLQLYEA